jgi:CRP/FNR family cyclic AMP-dependent transcriptional regulator
MNDAELQAVLSRNPWFAALPAAVRGPMVAQAELLRLRPGEMLFRQGDPPGGFFALLQGTLKASSVREDGREAILAVLEAGTWFGEISLIDGEPRTHDATAVGPVAVLMLAREDFDILMQQAVFARAIAAMLAARMRLLYGLVEDATLRSTRARIARRLLLLARGDLRPRVPVSQEGLAMMLGITRQTLSRELGKMVKQGLVQLGYGYIDVLSEEGLKQLTHRA